MSLPPERDNEGYAIGDLAARVRILEAKQDTPSTGGGFGESVDLAVSGQTGPVLDYYTVEWFTLCDPHNFHDSGTPEEIVIPTGLSGKYMWVINYQFVGL